MKIFFSGSTIIWILFSCTSHADGLSAASGVTEPYREASNPITLYCRAGVEVYPNSNVQTDCDVLISCNNEVFTINQANGWDLTSEQFVKKDEFKLRLTSGESVISGRRVIKINRYTGMYIDIYESIDEKALDERNDRVLKRKIASGVCSTTPESGVVERRF